MGKWRRHVVLSLGILLACCLRTRALDPSLDISQYAHTPWKVRDGFTTGSINSLAQTPDGYLWVGTEFGLFRFDGVRAAPWQPAGGELPGSNIEALLAAHDGALWIGTNAGLSSWKNGKLTTYPELAGHQVVDLAEDRDGTVWAGGVSFPPPGKLCGIGPKDVRCYGEDGAFGIGPIDLHEDSKGQLWVGVVSGMWRWTPGRPEFFSVHPEADGIRTFAEGDAGALLVGSTKEIQRLIDGRIEAYPLPGFSERFQTERMLRDRDGGLWIGTLDRGLLHVHQGRTDALSKADGLSGDRINRIIEDREGNIWVATQDGLDRFRDHAVYTLSVNQGLSNGVAWSVLAARDGILWIGNTDGLNSWKNNRMSLFGTTTGTPRPEGRSSRLIPNSLFQDSNHRIWVSTHQGFGYLANERFVEIAGFPAGETRDIAELGAGDLWVAHQQTGLLHVAQERLVEQIPWTRLGYKDFALAMAADPSRKGLWLGFFKGGIAYVADGRVRASYSAANGLSRGRVNGLRFGPRGALWVATEGGLSRIKEGHIATLTSKNGLPCDAVTWSMEDDDHSVWLYMPCGLARIPRSELDAWVADSTKAVKATVFDNSDGVRGHSIPSGYGPRVTKSADGKIWFTTWDGISVIDPHHLPINRLPPPVHIEKIVADDKAYEIANGMRLPAPVRNLTIDYTALSLAAPEKVHFRFQLEGQDKDWREVVNDRQVQYSNLPPKHYKFRVLACNNSGVWNEEGAMLEFEIPPAWYQTTWFRAACGAAFLAIISGIYELRVRQLAAQFNMRLEERISERARIARDLHDTLLQSFQGLVFRFQAVRNQLPNRPEKACEVLDSALISADQAIAEGRNAIQELRSGSSQESTLEQMLLALGRELAASQKGGASAPPLRVIVEGNRLAKRAIVKEEIYRIARELLRNAYRHADARGIEAELRYDDDAFLLVVRDDGKGIDPRVLKDRGRAGHWGLPGMYERAEAIGARLDMWSEAGAGTEARLTVPGAIAYEKSGKHGRFKLFRKSRIQ